MPIVNFSRSPSLSSCYLIPLCAQRGKTVMKDALNSSQTSRNIRVSGDFRRNKFQNFQGCMTWSPLEKIDYVLILKLSLFAFAKNN